MRRACYGRAAARDDDTVRYYLVVVDVDPLSIVIERQYLPPSYSLIFKRIDPS
jgi:hypothetical protein